MLDEDRDAGKGKDKGSAKGKGKGKAVFVLDDGEEGKEEGKNIGQAYTRPTLRNAGGVGLPTPSKTPSRKRKLAPEQVASSAQALFPPTEENSSKSESASKGGLFGVRKSRATSTSIATTSTRRKSIAGTIVVDGETETGIEIFTDSVERRPTFDAGPENPFITQPGDETRSAKKTRQQRADRSRNRLGNAGERSDGMVYIFRGKRVFKSFSKLPDAEDRAASEDVDEEGRGLNPTQVQPRVLFPSVPKSASKAKSGLMLGTAAEEADEVDEEAETDIDDVPQSQTSSIIVKTRKAGGRLSVSRMTPESEDEMPTTTKISSFKARIAAAAAASSASSASASSSKKRLSSSKALFDDGEDGAWRQSSTTKGGFASDDEVPAPSPKTRGVKRGITETGLTTPASTVRKRTRRAFY